MRSCCYRVWSKGNNNERGWPAEVTEVSAVDTKTECLNLVKHNEFKVCGSVHHQSLK